MAKKNEGVIALEISKYEEKIKEFQDYLEQNNVVTKVTSKGEYNEADNVQDKRHKEILIQIKMMDALPNWLSALKKLREEEIDKLELRGGTEMSDAARIMIERNKNK